MYNTIEGDTTKPKHKFDSQWKMMNRKATLIRHWSDLSIYILVEIETKVKKMWENLKELYEKKKMQNKIFLIRKILNMNTNIEI